MKSVILILTTSLLPFLQVYSQEITTIAGDSSAIKSNKKSAILYPNSAGKSLMTPAGWGAKGKFIFVGLGGVYPRDYFNETDLIAVAGFGAGNSSKAVSIAAAININDVSKFGNYSLSLFATHTFKDGGSIGAGGLHLFPNHHLSDSRSSFYLRYSRTVQNVPSIVKGYSKINYTIGAGSGRFAKNSEKDIETGKNKYGTILFGNISYEVIKNANINLEWSGVNLCVTAGIRPLPTLPAINFGVANLTRYSGDKAHIVFGFSYAFYLPEKK